MDRVFPISAIIDRRGRKSVTENWLHLTCTCLLSVTIEGIIIQYWDCPYLLELDKIE